MRIDDVLGELRRSKKYSSLSEDTLRRVCARACARYPKRKDALKAAKNELHIIYGMFFPEDCHKKAAALLPVLAENPDDRVTHRAVLALHASTNERLPHIEDFYTFIFTHMPRPRSLCDIGCGFNPFSLPWMTLPPDVRYDAFDLSAPTAELFNSYFTLKGLEPRAHVCDIMQGVPEGEWDAAFLFKLLPLLEQQEKGFTHRLLSVLNARYIIITYPIKSLGGREKGMTAHYSAFMEGVLPRGLMVAAREIIGNELVYVLKNV